MSEAELPRIVMRKYTGFPQLQDECTTAVETLHLLDAAKEVVQAIGKFDIVCPTSRSIFFRSLISFQNDPMLSAVGFNLSNHC